MRIILRVEKYNYFKNLNNYIKDYVWLINKSELPGAQKQVVQCVSTPHECSVVQNRNLLLHCVIKQFHTGNSPSMFSGVYYTRFVVKHKHPSLKGL